MISFILYTSTPLVVVHRTMMHQASIMPSKSLAESVRTSQMVMACLRDRAMMVTSKPRKRSRSNPKMDFFVQASCEWEKM